MWVLNEISQNNRKKYYKYIFVLFLLWISVFWYFHFQNWTKIDIFKTTKVEKRDIVSTFSNDWKVLYKEIYDLNFLSNWVLKNIYKNEWDNVNSWELIAKLDDTYLKINLDKAKIALKTANANLEAKFATKWQETDVNITQKQLELSNNSLQTSIKDWQINITNAQKNVDSINIDLNNTINSTQKDIENAQKSLDLKLQDLQTAKSNLESTISSENLNITNSIEKLKEQLNSSVSIFENYLNDEDIILWITQKNKNFNNDFEIYLWAKNTQTKTIAENNFSKALKDFDEFKANLFNFSKDNYTDFQTEFDILNNNLNISLNSTLEMLKSSVSSLNFTQSIIDNYILNIKNDINWLNSEKQKILAINQAISTNLLDLQTKTISVNNTIDWISLQINQAQTNLEKVKLQSKSTIDDLTQKLKIAQENLSQAKIKLENTILLSNSQVDISKATLDNKISDFDKRELSPYYTQIENAKKWVEEAQKKLDDAKIYSPINWQIAKIYTTKIWTLINQNISIPFATVIDKKSIYVETKIEQWDIKNIFLWQEVKLTFNSLNDFFTTWKVTFISDKSDTDANGIVSYKVLINFDKIDKKIKEWFTLQAYFTLNKANNVLSLPIESIKTVDNISSVTLKDKTIKTIKIWISDWDYVEVIDWLKLWDEVIY